MLKFNFQFKAFLINVFLMLFISNTHVYSVTAVENNENQPEGLEQPFIDEGITTRIYRSNDNIEFNVKKMSFADSAFKNDVFSKDDFLSMIFSSSKKNNPALKKYISVDRDNGFILLFIGLLLLVFLFIIFKIFKMFKI